MKKWDYIDLTGQRFGRNYVVGLANIRGNANQIMWNCLCDCGKSHIVSTGTLRRGDSRSCGCLQKDTVIRMQTTHGDSKSRLYRIWRAIRQRTGNIKNTNYHNYGGRGITVCSEWSDYAEFSKWSLDNGYTDQLTIDRININGNYEPSNCRWVTIKTQSFNKRNNHLLTYKGETKTLTEWRRQYGFAHATFYKRLDKWGDDLDKVFQTPINKSYARVRKDRKGKLINGVFVKE